MRLGVGYSSAALRLGPIHRGEVDRPAAFCKVDHSPELTCGALATEPHIRDRKCGKRHMGVEIRKGSRRT